MSSTHWTVDNIPDQRGKCIVITGATSGLGYQAALALAGKGAEVVLAVRNPDKGTQVVAAIRQAHSRGAVEAMRLDLADLGNVRRFAGDFSRHHSTLSVLIDNAGVMALPYRRTVDGFEMQFGTNHLGHFALTGLLMPLIAATPGARVVTVSSMMHLFGRMNFADLNGTRKYNPWAAYEQSKLANLLFAYELDRRFKRAGLDAISLACHPGYAATNLQYIAAEMNHSRVEHLVNQLGNALLATSAAMGALPELYAATAAGLHGGEYIAPQGLSTLRGYPGVARSSPRSYNVAAARQLWQISEDLTGVRYLDAPE